MLLLEKIKDFLTPPKTELEDLTVPSDKIQKDYSQNDIQIDYFSFFNDGIGGNFYEDTNRVATQAQKIDIYRQTAKIDNVAIALGIIADELVYTEEFRKPLSLHCDFDNPQIEKAVSESFEKILKLFNMDKNIYHFVLSSYIDGQMAVHLMYDNNGISKVMSLDPRFLTYNVKENRYKYLDMTSNYAPYFSRATYQNVQKEFQIEEIVTGNFDLISEDGIVLGELEKIIKTANQLKTLEDLLIPLRFSRSISRRVFNVDVSDLPNSKAEAYMKEVARKFKYRKEYNTLTGEIKNQQHMTSMVEDYWISSRGGQKGITVDLLDEQGNLGQLEDIKLFQRKLFQGMGIPENRLTDEQGQSSSIFDLAADQITSDDIKFFMKIRRLRNVYTDFLKNILKRDLIYSKKFTEEQFEELKDQIDIKFTSENQFMDRMRTTLFMKKLESWSAAREYAGKLFPVKYLYKTIFGMEDDEIDELLKEIEKESKDPLLAQYYKTEESEADFE